MLCVTILGTPMATSKSLENGWCAGCLYELLAFGRTEAGAQLPTITCSGLRNYLLFQDLYSSQTWVHDFIVEKKFRVSI